MIGGFVKGNKLRVDSLQFFIAMVAIFFIKAWLVQWSYNRVFPVLKYNMTGSQGEFRKLTYLEAIVVVILFNNLFNR